MSKPEHTFFYDWPKEQWEKEARAACMDYLHGIASDNEAEAACCYEYSSESEVLRYAAEERKKLISQPEKWNVGLDNQIYDFENQVYVEVSKRFDNAVWMIQGWCPAIWQCSSFPQLPWNELGQGDRKIIARHFSTTKIRPLLTKDVCLLDAMRVFGSFKQKAAKVRGLRKENPPQMKENVPAVLTTEPRAKNKRELPWAEVLFTIDFIKTKKRLLREFEAWLDLPENQQRLKTYGRKPTGKTGEFKDRLCDLAKWRLFDRLGFDEMLNFTKANRKKFDAPATCMG